MPAPRLDIPGERGSTLEVLELPVSVPVCFDHAVCCFPTYACLHNCLELEALTACMGHHLNLQVLPAACSSCTMSTQDSSMLCQGELSMLVNLRELDASNWVSGPLPGELGLSLHQAAVA